MCRGSRKLFKPVNTCHHKSLYGRQSNVPSYYQGTWRTYVFVTVLDGGRLIFTRKTLSWQQKYWFTTVRVKDWDCHNTTTKITRWWMLFISVFIHFHFIFIISINFFQLLRKNCIIYLSNLKDYQNIKYTLKQIIYISIS